ncbi:glycosyltransferase [Halorhabdus rudnickae]|uniref:glycosyltransferase n=1 Tax=Halorhabdus rudnickae TaxID=1775544 RepID=UPI001082B0B5|nr:glycosyltransferase [Halorhabdus rudnickae]
MDIESICVLAPPADHGGIGRYADQLNSRIEEQSDIEHIPFYEEIGALDVAQAAVRASHYDVVHIHFEYGLFRPKLLYAWLFFPLLFLGTRLRGTSVVVTLHEVWTTRTVGRIQYVYVWFVHLMLTGTASRLVFMSQSAKDDFRPRNITESELIPHGVDIDAVRDIGVSNARDIFEYSTDETVIAQIGYVSRRKGTDTFLELARRHPEYEFLIAGGPLRDEDLPYFERVIRESPENVQVTGVLSDASFHAAFVATDVAVLAYRDIRQSGILNWCFAYGVPVICRSIDRFRALCARSAPLQLFGDGDEHPPIDTALSMVLDDAETRGPAMRDFGERYALSTIADSYVRLYRSIR